MIFPDFWLQLLFWICLSLLFYTYLGYGMIIWIMVFIKKIFSRPENAASKSTPNLSVIVAAYNEATVLGDKISNLLSLDYPRELLQIIIVTDGSTDHSAQIIAEFPEILHLHETERRGKAAALNRAVQAAAGEILVFSDANTMMNPLALLQLSRHFTDPTVGGVAGEKSVLLSSEDSAAEAGEGLYWKYESFLKKLDSALYTTVGAAGELFAMRRNLYEAPAEDIIIEDFFLSLKLCINGYRVRYEPAARASESASASLKEEFKRKTRIAAGAFQAMGRLKQLFNPFRQPLLSFQFISHRVLRWTVCPPALILLFLANLMLALRQNAPIIYQFSMLLQLGFYLLALIGLLRAGKKNQSKLFYIPFYFLFMNYAAMVGFWRFIRGKQSVLWEKSKRQA